VVVISLGLIAILDPAAESRLDVCWKGTVKCADLVVARFTLVARGATPPRRADAVRGTALLQRFGQF
jgi:hypothetical protein